ncbi:hypothetical protein KIN20_001715, partial [Parelaphostrongylus tenuis]
LEDQPYFDRPLNSYDGNPALDTEPSSNTLQLTIEIRVNHKTILNRLQPLTTKSLANIRTNFAETRSQS